MQVQTWQGHPSGSLGAERIAFRIRGWGLAQEELSKDGGGCGRS